MKLLNLLLYDLVHGLREGDAQEVVDGVVAAVDDVDRRRGRLPVG